MSETKHTPKWVYDKSYGHIVDENLPCNSGNAKTDAFYGGEVICETVSSKYADILLAAPTQQARIEELEEQVEKLEVEAYEKPSIIKDLNVRSLTKDLKVRSLTAQVEQLRGLCQRAVDELDPEGQRYERHLHADFTKVLAETGKGGE